jgi:hypothetical protein
MSDITQAHLQKLEREQELLEEQISLKRELLDLDDKAARAVEAVRSAQRAYNNALATGSENTAMYKEALKEATKAAEANTNVNKDRLNTLLQLDMELQKHQKKIEMVNKGQALYNDLAAKGSSALNMLNSAVTTFTGLNLDLSLSGVVKEFARLTFELDSSTAALAKATGFTQRYQKNIESAARSARRFGGSFSEGGEAIAGLNNNMTLFATLGTNQQNILQDTSIALAAMGVDAAQTGQALDLLTRGMNMSAGGALSAVRDFDLLAQSVGLPTSQIVSDFVALGPELAKFGSRAPKVFGKMQRQARRLGLDVKEAFNIEQQFETFEGAAALAGKLNAQMGLRLNSIELMRAKEGERIDLMRQEFAERGMNFAQLDRWQRKATAQILGVDVSAAEKIFGTPADLAKYQDELQTIEKRAAAMTDVTKLFKGAVEDLFIRFLPDIKAFGQSLRDMAETLNMEVIRGWGRTFKNAMIAGTVVTAALAASVIGIAIKMGIAVSQTRLLVIELAKAAAASQAINVGGVGGGITPSASSPTGYRNAAGQFARPPSGAPTAPPGGGASRLGGMGGLVRGLGGAALMAGGSYAKDKIGGTGGTAVNYAASIGGGALMGSMFGPVGMAIGAAAGLLKAGYEQYSDATSSPMQAAPQMQDGLRDKDGRMVRASAGDKFIETVAGTSLVKSRSEEAKSMKDQAAANAEALKPLFGDLLSSNEKVASRPVVASLSKNAVVKAVDNGLFSGPSAKYGMFETV